MQVSDFDTAAVTVTVTVCITCSSNLQEVLLQDGFRTFDKNLNAYIKRHSKTTLIFGAHFDNSSTEDQVEYQFKSKYTSQQHPEIPSYRKKVESFLKESFNRRGKDPKIFYIRRDGNMTIHLLQQGLKGTLTIIFNDDSNPTSITAFREDFDSAFNLLFEIDDKKEPQIPHDLMPDCTVEFGVRERRGIREEREVQQVTVIITSPRINLYDDKMEEFLKDHICTTVDDEARKIFEH